jgi:DNA-binding transcriptional LysR family regulator
LQLTPEGRVYFEGCQALWDHYLELEASVRRTHAATAFDLRVAAIYSIGLGDMGQLIERFQERLPAARVQVEYLHPGQVCARVVDGTVDFGLVSFPRKTRLLHALPWREEEMVLACAPSHPLAASQSVRPHDLAGAKYIGFDKNLQIRREVDRFLRNYDVAVEVVAEFDNIESIKKAVEDSVGVALLPEPTLRREVQAGTLVAVPLTGARLVRPLGIIHRRHHKLGSTAQRFIGLLRHPDSDPSAAPSVRPGRNGAARAAKRSPRVASV